MNKIITAAILAITMTLTGCQSTGNLDPNQVVMNKRMVSMERGIVLMSESVMVKPSELNQGTKAGAAIAAAGLGTATVGGLYGGRNIAAAGGGRRSCWAGNYGCF
ncbi:hypothetical protein [Vibrio sp. BS-M-Sm-2]|uniref:hypothetical protein n=1 Tax=Vibrio sp. BS-M-Sm-2 TaxID=3241167 RepID=UPI00390C8DB9